MIDRTGEASRIDLGENVTAWRFDGSRKNRSVVALWARYDPVRLSAELRQSAVAVNSFGREIASGHDLSIDLDTLPLYVSDDRDDAEELHARLADASLETTHPVTIRNAYLATATEVIVELFNQTNQPVEITLAVGGETVETDLPAGTSRIRVAANVEGLTELDIEVASSGDRLQHRIALDVVPIAPVGDVRVDGTLTATANLHAITLADHQYILPVDPGIPWEGKESARDRGMTDEEVDDLSMKLLIGEWVAGIGSRTFIGTINEILIANRVLTEDEIEALARHGIRQALTVAPDAKLAATWGEMKAD